MKSVYLAIVLLSVFPLSACFRVQPEERADFISNLPESTWPVNDGVYTRLASDGQQEIRIQRQLTEAGTFIPRGQRIYSFMKVVTGGESASGIVLPEAEGFVAFYPQGNELYILESFIDLGDASDGQRNIVITYQYAIVEEGTGIVLVFENSCEDISRETRLILFGSRDASNCFVSNVEGRTGLRVLLDQSQAQKETFDVVYRPTQ